MFTVVLLSTKRVITGRSSKVITELIAKIFVLGRVAVAERVESSITAVFITVFIAVFITAVFIAAMFIAMFIAEVKENVTIEAEQDRTSQVKLCQVAK